LPENNPKKSVCLLKRKVKGYQIDKNISLITGFILSLRASNGTRRAVYILFLLGGGSRFWFATDIFLYIRYFYVFYIGVCILSFLRQWRQA